MNNPKKSNPKEAKPFIRPFYTVTELSVIFGRSRYGTRLLLYRMNIPLTYVGRKLIITLSDIRDFSPALWSSILEANQLNHLIRLKKKRLTAEDFVIPEQFDGF